jgi:negative regulator of replication initiation
VDSADSTGCAGDVTVVSAEAVEQARTFLSDDQYVIEGEAVERIRRVMRRLYSENRMNGDTMRDAAQDLDAALRYLIPLKDAR